MIRVLVQCDDRYFIDSFSSFASMKAGKEKPQAEKTPRAKAANEKPVPTLQLETAQVDYGVYVMMPAETLTAWLAAAAVLFALGYVFYRSVVISLLFALFAFRYPRMRAVQIADRRRAELTLQFKDMLYSISSAVGAGSSVEHALEIALADMRKQYADPKTSIIRELELMVSRLSFGWNVEDVFLDFGRRSHADRAELGVRGQELCRQRLHPHRRHQKLCRWRHGAEKRAG